MSRSLYRTIESPRPCSYLHTEKASLEYDFLVDVQPDEYEAMLERGWRRFGRAYFRPACSPCGECVSLRVSVADFVPSRSQRRAAKAGAHLRCEMGRVRVDNARVALYTAWHEDRQRERGWSPMPLDTADYASEFAVPHPCARELAYYDDDAPAPSLVGLGLCDETPHAWSALYFFYQPGYSRTSLGVNHLVTLIGLARAQGKAHVYLGYRVNGCPSMRYKAAYTPHQLLDGRPGPAEAPLWRR